ncbi:hypothetical protein ACQUSR_28205 [Streptomyces sp. P1-3]|uniref:hypothetical protein n=1 Tax=Streptomyces sp. P1-3 TaxID=3421658 RepID=UPI003D36EC60
MSAPYLEAIERVSAAICRVHGWSARSVIGHLEWQPGKADPRRLTMASMRDRVADRLGQATPDLLPAPARPKVSLSKLMAAREAIRGRSLRHHGCWRSCTAGR